MSKMDIPLPVVVFAAAGVVFLLIVAGIDQDWPIVDCDARPRWYGIPMGKR